MKKYTEVSLLVLMGLPVWTFICLTSYIFLAILNAIRINHLTSFPKESIVQISEISFNNLKNDPTLIFHSLTLEEPNGIVVTLSVYFLIGITFVEHMPGGGPLWPRVNKIERKNPYRLDIKYILFRINARRYLRWLIITGALCIPGMYTFELIHQKDFCYRKFLSTKTECKPLNSLSSINVSTGSGRYLKKRMELNFADGSTYITYGTPTQTAINLIELRIRQENSIRPCYSLSGCN